MLNTLYNFWHSSAKPIDVTAALVKGATITAAFLGLGEYPPGSIDIDNVFKALFVAEGANFATTLNRRLSGEEVGLAIPAVATTLAMAGSAEVLKASALAPNCFFGVFLSLTVGTLGELNKNIDLYNNKMTNPSTKKELLKKIIDNTIKTTLYAGGVVGPAFGLGVLGYAMPEMCLAAAIFIGTLTAYTAGKSLYDSYSSRDGWINLLGARCGFWVNSKSEEIYSLLQEVPVNTPLSRFQT